MQIMKQNNSRKPADTYVIPMPVTDETIRDYGIDPGMIRWALVGSKKCRVAMIPATKEQYDAFMQPLWAEQKREARERRCVISGKGGKLVRCPDSRSCVKCPHYQHIDHNDNKPTSVEMLVEKSQEPVSMDAFEDTVANFALLDTLVERLSELSPEYVEILRLLIDELPQADIAEMLHMKPRTLSDKVKRIREIAWSIFFEE